MYQLELFPPSPPPPPIPPAAMLGRWLITPAAIAEARARLAEYRARAAAEAERHADLAHLQELPFDDDAPACSICDDELEIDCEQCGGVGCASCEDSGRQACACEGGPDEADEDLDDGEV